ncbi:MAG: hypothetical protein IJ795_00225 [Bacteroidales bacterium]|nr:hypothetical protein [Bacteroidales bacterium]
MVSFIGTYSAKVDDKGRVVFPSPLKSLMPEGGDMRFVLHKDIHARCLEMYTFEQWQSQSEGIKSKLNSLNPRHAAFWRGYMQNRALVEPDGKLGRISIPRDLQTLIGIDKEVVFVGNDYKIEIWARDEYEKSIISQEDFTALATELSQQL